MNHPPTLHLSAADVVLRDVTTSGLRSRVGQCRGWCPASPEAGGRSRWPRSAWRRGRPRQCRTCPCSRRWDTPRAPAAARTLLASCSSHSSQWPRLQDRNRKLSHQKIPNQCGHLDLIKWNTQCKCVVTKCPNVTFNFVWSLSSPTFGCSKALRILPMIYLWVVTLYDLRAGIFASVADVRV